MISLLACRESLRSARTRLADGYHFARHLIRHLWSYRHHLGRLRWAQTLTSLKRSDTLFIIGSGATLNDLSRDEWSILSRHDTAGLSFGCLLPIRYTYFFYEAVDGRETELREISRFVVQHLREAARERRIGATIVKDMCVDSTRLTYESLDQFYVIPEVILPTDDPAELQNQIRLIMRFGLHRYFLFKKRATVFSIALFGAALGYSRVVFCGVDLNDTRYFFQDPFRYPEFASIPTGQSSHGGHRTIDPTLGMPIDLALQALVNAARSGPTFFVSSPASRLATFLDVFDFSAAQHHRL